MIDFFTTYGPYWFLFGIPAYFLFRNYEKKMCNGRWTCDDRFFGLTWCFLLGPFAFFITLMMTLALYIPNNGEKPAKW